MFAVVIASLFTLVILTGLLAGIALGLVRARNRLAGAIAYASPATVRPPRAAVRAVLVPV